MALRRRVVALAPRTAPEARRRALRLAPTHPLQKAALRRDPSLAWHERQLLRHVKSRISSRDTMYDASGMHYFAVGLSAVRCINEALKRSGSPEVQTILDLPSGHGRVLRWLAVRFPQARIIACDLDRDGVDWCARTFGAAPAYSCRDFTSLSLGEFDLIWCGSLITHLDADRIFTLLDLFRRHLKPGKLVVLTTNGDRAARGLQDPSVTGISPEEVEARILTSYAGGGFGYANYPGEADYGVSLSSPEWVRSQAARIGGLREVWFRPHGWDDHQDVFAFVRS